MKKFTLLCFLQFALVIRAQVGIGTVTPDASASLEIASTTSGFLPPRMTAFQRDLIQSPAQGLMLYCTDCGDNGELQIYNGSNFVNLLNDSRALTKDYAHVLGLTNGWQKVALSKHGNFFAVRISTSVLVYEFANGVASQVGNSITTSSNTNNHLESLSLSANGSIVAFSLQDSVRIFEYSNGNWAQKGSGIPSATPYYVIELDSTGNSIILGSQYFDGNNLNNNGLVRVYNFSNGQWVQVGADFQGSASSDKLGYDVSISADGSRIALSIPYANYWTSMAGEVKIYDLINSSWSQVGGTISNGTGEDFGNAIKLSSSGNRIAISSRYNPPQGLGYVMVFDLVNGAWTQVGNTLSGSVPSENFGMDLDISSDGKTMVIGSAQHPLSQTFGSTSLRIYNLSGNQWVQSGNPIIDTSSVFKYSSCRISGDGTLVIAIGSNSGCEIFTGGI